jgi:truncated hemoglobin YjbI
MTTATLSTLSDVLGGLAGIRRAVQQVFERIVEDPELSQTFARADVPYHVDALTSVVVSVVGVSEPTACRHLDAAYEHLRVTDQQFARIVDHLLDVVSGRVPTGEPTREFVTLIIALRSELVIAKPFADARAA